METSKFSGKNNTFIADSNIVLLKISVRENSGICFQEGFIVIFSKIFLKVSVKSRALCPLPSREITE